MPDILYLDIETVANPEMVKFIPEPEPVTYEDKPKRWKDPLKIAAWIEEKTKERRENYDEKVAKMALDVDYAMVKAIGFSDDSFRWLEVLTQPSKTEEEILERFWGLVSARVHPNTRLCGYNILGFDLPVILRRSWQFRIRPTRLLDFRRYSTRSIIDLMQILYNWGQAPGVRYRGLKEVAKMYRIENPLHNLDGSMVATMDETTLCEYCRNDVRMTRELANRTRGYYWK